MFKNSFFTRNVLRASLIENQRSTGVLDKNQNTLYFYSLSSLNLNHFFTFTQVKILIITFHFYSTIFGVSNNTFTQVDFSATLSASFCISLLPSNQFLVLLRFLYFPTAIFTIRHRPSLSVIQNWVDSSQ